MSFKVPDRSTLGMYRDCLKTAKYMTQDPKAQLNISKHFRMEFEKQRLVTDNDKHQEFRMGITRLLSNYILFDIKKQYQADPKRFSEPVNIHSRADQEAEEKELQENSSAA